MISDILPLLIPPGFFFAYWLVRDKHGWFRNIILGAAIGALLSWPIVVIIDHFVKETIRAPLFWFYPAFFFFVGLIICIDIINILRRKKESRLKSGAK